MPAPSLLLGVHLALPLRLGGSFHGACFDAIFAAAAKGDLPEGFDAGLWPAPVCDGAADDSPWEAPAVVPIGQTQLSRLAHHMRRAGVERFAFLSMAVPMPAWRPSLPMAAFDGRDSAKSALEEMAAQAANRLSTWTRLAGSEPLFSNFQCCESAAPALPNDPLTRLDGGYSLMLDEPFLSQSLERLAKTASILVESHHLRDASSEPQATASRPRL